MNSTRTIVSIALCWVVGCCRGVAGSDADEMAANLIWSIIEQGSIVSDIEEEKDVRQIAKGFAPPVRVRDFKRWADAADAFSDSTSHLAPLMAMGLAKAGENDARARARQARDRDRRQLARDREGAIERDDFLTFLLGADNARAIRDADAHQRFGPAVKRSVVRNWRDEEALGPISVMIALGLEGGRRRNEHRDTHNQPPQPSSPPAGMSANTDYVTLNNRAIAAFNADNQAEGNAILNTMQQQGVPVAPETKAAIDRHVDRWVDREMAPVRQALSGFGR